MSLGKNWKGKTECRWRFCTQINLRLDVRRNVRIDSRKTECKWRFCTQINLRLDVRRNARI